MTAQNIKRKLIEAIPELLIYRKGIISEAQKRARQRLGGQMTLGKWEKGEEKEQYDIDLRDETRLEFVFMLRELACVIEYNTLHKDEENEF